jgi:hypothetical protein
LKTKSSTDFVVSVIVFNLLENAKNSLKQLIFMSRNKLVYKRFLRYFSAGTLKIILPFLFVKHAKIDIAPLNSAMVNVTASQAEF